jgi:OHCU decarboxylase
MAALAYLAHGLDRAAFIARFGDVYRHNPWVAAAAYDSGAVGDTLGDLAAALRAVIEAAPEDAQLTLLQSQPTDVQALIAQAACTEAEVQALQKLIGAYSARFGFPFVIAARGIGSQRILEQCAQRMGNSRAVEVGVALEQLHRIAEERLEAMAADG